MNWQPHSLTGGRAERLFDSPERSSPRLALAQSSKYTNTRIYKLSKSSGYISDENTSIIHTKVPVLFGPFLPLCLSPVLRIDNPIKRSTVTRSRATALRGSWVVVHLPFAVFKSIVNNCPFDESKGCESDHPYCPLTLGPECRCHLIEMH